MLHLVSADMSTFNTFQQYSDDFGLGNNGLKITLNYFDGLPDQSLIHAVNSNDLKLCFKTLMKRDETTRERALNGLVQLVDQDPEIKNEVTMLLWTQFYPKLVTCELKTIRALAHEVTCKFISLWGKKISKFLKDLIPLLMSGLYDPETYVVKAASQSITSVFNSVEKIEALWEKFIPEHCKLIHEVLLIESKDTISDEKFVSKTESNAKYTRLVTTCTFIMVHLLKKYPTLVLQQSNYLETLHAENLWSFLSVSKAVEDGPKPCQILLQMINFLDATDDALFSWKENKSTFKIISKKLLKFISKVTDQNKLSVGLVLTPVLHSINLLSVYNNGKLWGYDKNIKPKLINFFNVGPAANTFPSYYDEVYLLTKCETEEGALLDALKEWLPIWLSFAESETKRPQSQKSSKEFLVHLWKNLLKFVQEHGVEKTTVLSYMSKTLYAKRLEENEDLKKEFSLYMPYEYLEEELLKNLFNKASQKYVFNLFSIVRVQTANNLHALAGALLNEILENEDKAKDNLGFQLFHELISSNVEDESVLKFLYELPTLITEDFYELPNQIIADFTNSDLAQNEKTMEILSDYILALTNLNIDKHEILKTICSFNQNISNKLLQNSDDLKDFLQTYYEYFEFDNATLFGSPFITKDTAFQLYQKALNTNKAEQYFALSLTLPSFVQQELLHSLQYLSDFRKQFLDQDWLGKIAPYVQKDDQLATMVVNMLTHLASMSTAEHITLLKELAMIAEINESSLSALLKVNLFDLDKHISGLDSGVALVSSFGVATHLLEVEENLWSTNKAQIVKLLNTGAFIDLFLQTHKRLLTDEATVFLTFIYEIAQDFNSITDSPDDHLLNISNTIYNSSQKLEAQAILESIIFEKDNQFEFHSLLFSWEEKSSLVGYYQCKIVYTLLINSIDAVSNVQFEELFGSHIDKYITRQIRSTSTSGLDHLKSCVLLLSFQKFGSLSVMGKLRNMLAAELIGSKTSEMLSKNYKTLIYLSCLLKSNEDYVPIQPQRVQMVLSSLYKLFDDEEWYLDSFGTLRLCIVEIFSLFAKFEQLNHNDLYIEMANRLLSDMMGMIQIDETPFVLELRHASLSLYKNCTLFDIPIEDSDEIYDNLLEMLFTKYTAEKENQISVKFFEAYNNVVQKISSKTLAKYYERLLATLDSASFNVSQLRVCIVLLAKIIRDRTEDVVVEFELSKNKISSPDPEFNGDSEVSLDSSDSKLEQFKIPQTYIDLLKNDMPVDYLEYSDEKGAFLRYLWILYLVAMHFSNISYNLRQFYLQQLKKEGELVDNVYTFIADEIQGTETFVEYHLQNFNIYKDDLMAECKELLIYDLYLMFDNFGVITSNWYLNIKSRQLQIKVEKFVSSKLSPLLVAKELKECSLKVGKIEESNEALSIKVNEKVKEIRASYLIDEQKLEIAFKFPDHYPLTPIQVVGISRIGVTENKWKSWILSTQKVITTMNGSIVDSLELFSKNVDLQFSGFEECAICYYVLNAIDRKLPTKQCPTCKYKFHSTCLYKWFKSSGNNTCPMCRGAFDFTTRSTHTQQVR